MWSIKVAIKRDTKHVLWISQIDLHDNNFFKQIRCMPAKNLFKFKNEETRIKPAIFLEIIVLLTVKLYQSIISITSFSQITVEASRSFFWVKECGSKFFPLV